MAIAQLQIPQAGQLTPNIDWSPLAALGTQYQQQQKDAIKQQTLATLAANPTGKIDPAPLLQSGDPTLATLGIQINNHNQDIDRQTKQDTRANTNDTFTHDIQTQQLALQKRTADRADEDKYTVTKVDNPDGTTSLYKFNPRTGDVAPLSTASAIPSTGPINPLANGKMTADQAKAGTMVDRMDQANGTITKNENINDGVVGAIGGAAAAYPKVRDSAFFNYFASPERQQTVQAQRNFVNAILRVESGAAISQSEFDNAQRQYFPQSGDSKDVIEQKRQNRVSAMQGMAREAGPMYRPPATVINPNAPRQQPQTAPAQTVQPAQPAPQQRAPLQPPQPGAIMDGHRFKGGDPSKQENWEPVA